MKFNLNKSFNNYFKSWALFYKNNVNLENLKSLVHSFYFNYLLNSQDNNFDESYLKKISYYELQFLLVELALIELSPQHREIIYLRYVDGLCWDIIAFRLNFSRRSCFYFRQDVINNIKNILENFCINFAPHFTNSILK